MGVLQVLSFRKITRDVISELHRRAKEIGCRVLDNEISIGKESGYWLIFPQRVHRDIVIYEDGMPVDLEKLVVEFCHVHKRDDGQIEIVFWNWDLSAVISPSGDVSWGHAAFHGLLEQVMPGVDPGMSPISDRLTKKVNGTISGKSLLFDGMKREV